MAIRTHVYAVVKTNKTNMTTVLEESWDFSEYWAWVSEGLTKEELKAYKIVGGYLSDFLLLEDFSQIME